MNTLSLDAYIIHKRPYRETSYLVDAFSAQWGKVSFVAKGAQQKRSQLKSQLQLFQPLQIQISGKSSLKNLIGCETTGPGLQLQGQFMYCGMYINELMSRLLQPEMPLEHLFQNYQASLLALAQQKSAQPVLRAFELALLDELGYGFSFCFDSEGEEIIAGQGYRYAEQQGFIPVLQGKNMIDGQWLLDIANNHWSGPALKTARFVCRLALKPLLGDKPLKSRELFITESI